jgi:hypothetical protein
MRHLRSYSAYHTLRNLAESISVEKIDPASYENETVLKLPYSNFIEDNRQSFLKKIVRVSKNLAIDPLWLLHIIFNESRFDSRKNDRITKGAGLLGFLPKVLSNFVNKETGKNYSVNDILQMSNTEQLDLIETFYKSWFNKMKLERPIVPGDFAAITFYPDVIDKDWDWEFPEYVVEKNPELFKSFPTDGKTKKDYYNYIDQILNSKEEYGEANNNLLGSISGAIVDPITYYTKKPLERYKDLVFSIENPGLGQKEEDKDFEDIENSIKKDK